MAITNRGWLGLMVVIGTVAHATPASPERLLNLEETWVAIGDSITEDGRAQTWIEYYLRACLGADEFHSVNAGIGGDTAFGVARRLDWDVLRSKPTLATLMLGMNDVDRNLYQVNSDGAARDQRQSRLENYEMTLRNSVEKLKAQKVRVVLVTPTPFEHNPALAQSDLPGVDHALGRCAEIMTRVASENGVPVIDVHTQLAALNAEFQRDHPGGTLIGPDRIHPGALGQFAIAVILLSGMEVLIVNQSLAMDAQTLKCECQGTGVDSIDRNRDGWSFRVTFSMLPFVVNLPDTPPEWVNRLKGARGELRFRVGNLTKGNYQLLADGTKCGIFSSERLAEGISLGELAEFPLTKVSNRLFALLRTKAEETGKLRVIAWSEHFAYPEGRPAEVAISEVEERLRQLQKAGAQSSPATIQRRLDVYGKWKAREPEIRARIEFLEKEASSISGKATIRIELQSVG